MKNFTLRFMMLAALLTAMTLPAHSEVVYVQPDGPVTTYTRTSWGFGLFQGQEEYEIIDQSGTNLEITFEGGNRCWIKNIVFYSEWDFEDYWVEGYVERDTANLQPRRITVPLGQVIQQIFFRSDNRNRSFTRSAVLAWGTLSFSTSNLSAISFARNYDVTSVSYIIDGNTIHQDGTSGPVVVDAQDDVSYDNITGLAIVWEEEGTPDPGEPSLDGELAGYFEWGTTAVNVDEPTIIQEQPFGTLKNYERSGYSIFRNRGEASDYTIGEQSGMAQLVYASDYIVYFKNPLCHLQYDTWIEGRSSKDYKTITITLPQIIHNDPVTGTQTLLYWGNSDNKNGFTVNEDHAVREVTFTVENNTIIMQGSEGDGIDMQMKGLTAFTWPNRDESKSTWAETLDFNTIFTPEGSQEKTAAPLGKFQPVEGSNDVMVTITATEGDVYYRIRFENEIGTWLAYQQPFVLTEPGHYVIEYYAKAADKLPSDIQALTFDIYPSTGVNEAMGAQAIASVRYFNAIGQEVKQPHGLTIKVITYTDGSSQAIKVIK